MSKRNKHWYEKKKETPLIEKIEKVWKHTSSEVHKADCRAFMDYYVRNGYLTEHMKRRAKEIVGFYDQLFTVKKKDAGWGVYYLYAISDGEMLKVGFTRDPERRLKTLQTGSYKELKMVWKCACAYTSKEAKTEERKLHRRIKSMSVRGEWFSTKALPICKAWRIRGMQEKKKRYEQHLQKEREQMDHDVSLIYGFEL